MSNESAVTRQGVEGARSGREAMTGVQPGGVPPATGALAVNRPAAPADATSGAPISSSYYGLPILKPPVWKPADIAGYLFLGGLAGASSAVAAAAHVSGRQNVARVAKLAAAGSIALSLGALVHDLGRPARALHMLRVFKFTSPMNVGSWLLAGFAPAAGVAATTEMTGAWPSIATAATLVAGVLGPMVAAYTGALIADTAVPSWYAGHRHMPFVFVASGASAAAGVCLAAASPSELAPVQRLAAVAAPAELALAALMESRMGHPGETYRSGKAAAFLGVGRAATALGALGALFARRDRRAARASGAALLIGSACTRFGIFHAGVASAKDPVYTVAPQRARLGARRSSGPHTPDSEKEGAWL